MEKSIWNLRSFSDEDNKRILKLATQTEDISVFEYEGLMYLGARIDAIKQFIHDNPTKADFHVWLQNNYRELK